MKSQQTFQFLDYAIIYLHIASTCTAWVAIPFGVVYPHASHLASILRHIVRDHPNSIAGVDASGFYASCHASAAETSTTACIGEAREAADQYPMLGFMAIIWIGAVFGTVFQFCCSDRYKLLSVSFYVLYGLGSCVIFTYFTVLFSLFSKYKTRIVSYTMTKLN